MTAPAVTILLAVIELRVADSPPRLTIVFAGRMRLPDGDLNDTREWDGARSSQVP